MIKSIWSLICQRILIDSDTKTVSYIDCLEEVQAKAFPVNLAMCSIGTLWEKSSNEVESLKVRVMVKAPSKPEKQLVETEKMDMAKKRHRVNFVLNGFPLEEAGTYEFKIERLDGDKWTLTNKLHLGAVLVEQLLKK